MACSLMQRWVVPNSVQAGRYFCGRKPIRCGARDFWILNRTHDWFTQKQTDLGLFGEFWGEILSGEFVEGSVVWKSARITYFTEWAGVETDSSAILPPPLPSSTMALLYECGKYIQILTYDSVYEYKEITENW